MKLCDLEKSKEIMPVRKFQREEWGKCKFIERVNSGIILVEDKRGNRHYVDASKVRLPLEGE